MQTAVRPPAVAGLFYPAGAEELAATVDRLLRAASATGPEPNALIAPHAGYLYSGPVAASAYKLLADHPAGWSRVVLLGPSHFVAVDGVALPSAEAFRTPLGDVPVDTAAVREALRLPAVDLVDRAHGREHGLEVHLPFLQRINDSFEIVPMVCGAVEPTRLARVIEAIEAMTSEPGTIVICSTDLSHYHDYDTARDLDRATCRAIEQRETGIEPDRACGSYALNGFLDWARQGGLEVTTLDLRNSGDTAGPRDRVVGYGAWALAPSAGQRARA